MAEVAQRRGVPRRLGLYVLVALAVGTALLLAMTLARGTAPGILGDLEIYRGAIRSALAGGDLYGWTFEHPTVHGLGFTYPPFAALLLAPVAWMEALPAKVLWTVLTFLALVACLVLVVRGAAEAPQARVGPTASARLTWVAGLAVPAMLSDPFLHNLVVGQVSIFVVALVLADQALPQRWRGTLVGVAAAVKLTPLVFVPLYLVTGQWRRAAVSGGVFAVAGAVGFALLPRASLDYWGEKLWQTNRVGRIDSTVNKSLLGVLTRQLPDSWPVHVVWLVLAVCVAVLAYWRAARHVRAGAPTAATLLVGALSVAVSPISWPHHQLWMVFAACWYLMMRGRSALLLGSTLVVVMAVYPLFADYPSGTVTGPLAIGVEVPALAALLVIGAGLTPGRIGRSRGREADPAPATG